MTDKVVKAGIEDVLSSIKRLVTEEDRKIPGVMASSNTRKPGRLVLTDALRVGEVAVKEKPQPEKAEPVYKAEDSVKPMLLRACDIVKHAEPAVEQQTTTEPEDGLTGSLSAKIEALETAIARTEDQWEPDGDSEDAYSGTPTKPLEWAAEVETPAKPLEWAAEDEFNITYSAKISQAETIHEDVDTATKATFVRDPAVVASAQAVKSEAKELHVRPTGKNAQTAGKDLPVMNTAPLATGQGALTLDEDAMRVLIAQVVREELQGVLGQRITRNVRKMVRREIYRALAEREVD
ncbi:hypothetical protein [Ruegeria arenilitoris]|uniref:hypothetical protein n=1 Tax=Ruegeria arenilitoris TaxID=1173585 RepID=UPI003C7CDCB3